MKLEITAELENQLMDLRAKSNQFYDAGQFEECIRINKQAWSLLPEPKENTSDSFHISRSLAGYFLKLGKLEEAEEWVSVLLNCAKHRIDMGERELLAAEVAFAKGEPDKARAYLKTADKNSKGNVWRIAPKEIIVFYK